MSTLVSKMPVEVSAGDLETRYVELGEMAIRHARVPAGTDFGPVLARAPGGDGPHARCHGLDPRLTARPRRG